MKKVIVSILFLATTSLIISSCNKNDSTPDTNDPSNRPALLLGSWKLTATGEDANRNEQLDPGENDLIPAGYSLTEVFRSNNTGTVYTTLPGNSKDTTQFNYGFLSSNTQLQVTLPTGNTIAKIITLNTTTLIVYDINTDPRRIFAFVKQ